jgi:hypothetical protein
MDKATAQALGEDIRDALAPVAAKYGLTVQVNGGKYSVTGSYEPRVKFTSADHEQAEWNRYAPLVDLPLNVVGETFDMDGHTYTIRGYLPKSRSYPVSVTDEFGANLKMRVTPALRRALGGRL